MLPDNLVEARWWRSEATEKKYVCKLSVGLERLQFDQVMPAL